MKIQSRCEWVVDALNSELAISLVARQMLVSTNSVVEEVVIQIKEKRCIIQRHTSTFAFIRTQETWNDPRDPRDHRH